MFIINGESWNVVFVDPWHPMLLKPDGEYAIGACDDYSNTIFLSKNLSGDRLKRVLCHEITHAALFSYRVKMPLVQEEFFAELTTLFGEEIIKTTSSR